MKHTADVPSSQDEAFLEGSIDEMIDFFHTQSSSASLFSSNTSINLTGDLSSSLDEDFSSFQSFLDASIKEMINTPHPQSNSTSIFSSNASINLTGDLSSSVEEDFISVQPFLDGPINEMVNTPYTQTNTGDLSSSLEEDFISLEPFLDGEMINSPHTQTNSTAIFSSNTSVNLTGDLSSSLEEDFICLQPFLDGSISEMNDTPPIQSNSTSIFSSNTSINLSSSLEEDFISLEPFLDGSINQMMDTLHTQTSSTSIFSSNSSMELIRDLTSSLEEDFFTFQPFPDGPTDEMNDTPRSQSSTASTSFSNNPTKKRGRNSDKDAETDEEAQQGKEAKKKGLKEMPASVLLIDDESGPSAASNHVSAAPFSVENNQTSSGEGQQRRLWVKNRSKAWWDEYNHPEIPESKFREAFRMSPSTFEMICDELNSEVAKKNTKLRAAIPVRKRVAVCIWRLATGESLQLVSKRFGLGIATCHNLVVDVCCAIKNLLMPKYIQLPDVEAKESFKNGFQNISGIPNVVGSMYTTHISIIAPKVKNGPSYSNPRPTEGNQKTSYSITLQGVVNPKGVFTEVCIGWPGSLTDDQILEKSSLYKRATQGELKDAWIVGSSSYPLMDWVLVPYTNQHLTWTQLNFNRKIGEVQSIAKEAFARLKGRWACLQKRTEVNLRDLPMVIGASCALHNICEMRNEVMDPKLTYNLIDDEMIPEINMRSEYALRARDNIAHNLLHPPDPALL